MQKYLKHYLTRFSKWLQYNPPGALTAEGWDLFGVEFRQRAPVRYFYSVVMKEKCFYPVSRFLRKIRLWVTHRTNDRMHMVDTGLEPGYYSPSEILLNANFSILKDYVEISAAHRYMWTTKDFTQSWCEKYMPLYNIFVKFRRPELGIKYLEHTASLVDNDRCYAHRSSFAKEVLELYRWWTETYQPVRNNKGTQVEIEDKMLIRLIKIRNNLHT